MKINLIESAQAAGAVVAGVAVAGSMNLNSLPWSAIGLVAVIGSVGAIVHSLEKISTSQFTMLMLIRDIAQGAFAAVLFAAMLAYLERNPWEILIGALVSGWAGKSIIDLIVSAVKRRVPGSTNGPDI